MAFALRPRFDWQLRTRTLALGERTRIMGILNVTPDSFSDGGHHPTLDSAVQHALSLLDQGADLIDLGGESTRPDAIPITARKEQDRVLPILEAILHERPQALISVDTFHASTARYVLQAGAEIINDVSGFTWDENMALVCAENPCGIILMHSRGRPKEWKELPSLKPHEVMPLVLDGLRASLALAHEEGIADNRLVLDPGFGFGKIGGENYALHAGLDQLQQLGLPLLVGTSRKGFLGRSLAPLYGGESAPIGARQYATTASNMAAILAGAHILRVHDPRPAIEAAAIADAILAAGEKLEPAS